MLKIVGPMIVLVTAFMTVNPVIESQSQVSEEVKNEINLLLHDFGKFSDLIKKFLTDKEMKSSELKDLIKSRDEKSRELDGGFKRLLDHKEVKQHPTLAKMLEGMHTLLDFQKGDKWAGRFKNTMSNYTARLGEFHLKTAEDLAKNIKSYLKAPKDFNLDCDVCKNKVLIECQSCSGGGKCKAVYKANSDADFCKNGNFSNFNLQCAVCNASGVCGFCFGTGKTSCPLFIGLNDLHKK